MRGCWQARARSGDRESAESAISRSATSKETITRSQAFKKQQKPPPKARNQIIMAVKRLTNQKLIKQRIILALLVVRIMRKRRGKVMVKDVVYLERALLMILIELILIKFEDTKKNNFEFWIYIIIKIHIIIENHLIIF